MFSLKIDEDLQIGLSEERHAEQIFLLVDQNRAYLREWLGWLDDTQSFEDVRAFIRSSLIKFTNSNGFEGSIWYKGQLAGGIGFHYFDWLNRRTEIGYWLAKSFQGKGIMTRATRSMVDYAFNEYAMNRVEIRCATGNLKSCAIPERLGFTFEGVQRNGGWLYDRFVDYRIYSILANEWLETGK